MELFPLNTNFDSFESYNATSFSNVVDSRKFACSAQRNVDSPTGEPSSSKPVSPSDTVVPDNHSNNFEYCSVTWQKDYFQAEHVDGTTYIEPQNAFFGGAVVNATPYMTSPTEISPTENYLKPGEAYQPSNVEAASVSFEKMTLTPPPPSETAHGVLVLKDTPRTWLYEEFIKIVGDDKASCFQCQIDECSTPRHLYQTMEDVCEHIEQELLRRRFACLCKVTFINLSDYQRHVKNKNNPHQFPCPACPRKFGRRDALKAHSVVHGVDPSLQASLGTKGSSKRKKSSTLKSSKRSLFV